MSAILLTLRRDVQNHLQTTRNINMPSLLLKQYKNERIIRAYSVEA
ncbi:MAG: hypothetical protein ABL911_02165 [Gallionella sp.]